MKNKGKLLKKIPKFKKPLALHCSHEKQRKTIGKNTDIQKT